MINHTGLTRSNGRLTGILLMLIIPTILGASFWYAMGSMGVEAAQVAQEFDCEGNEQEQNECNALVELYRSTDGPNWRENDGWLEVANYCDWYGVICGTTTMTVTELNLSGNLLNGSLPSQLGDLTNLEELVLTDNDISGGIPLSLSNMKSLKQIFLGKNKLTNTIPKSLGDLSSLTRLELQNNQLDGPIPSEIGGLKNLGYLRLNENRFEGEIPLELASLPSLYWLGLANNQLSGQIPINLGELQDLNSVYLNNNKLIGQIPNEWCDKDDLVLDISYNRLRATDPEIENCMTTLDGDWLETQTIPPTNVKSSNIASDTIQLTWNQVRYIPKGGYYEISTLGPITPTGPIGERVQEVPFTSDVVTVTALITELIPDNRYSFRIRSFTGKYTNAMASEYSQLITATPRDTFIIINNKTDELTEKVKVFLYRGNRQISKATPNKDDRVDSDHFSPTVISLLPGDELVALVERAAFPSGKGASNELAYTVYNTSMARRDDGAFSRHHIGSEGGEQILTVTVSNTLVLFDLAVSVEWEANRISDRQPDIPYDTFLKQLQRGLDSASSFLYDATDGQFAFGNITIYDGGRYWDIADLQILASNQVRPSAVVGGIVDTARTYTSTVGEKTVFYPGFLRMGRAWSRYSGRYGLLDQEDAYRTLIHEFSHYAFGLYDEYLPISVTDSDIPQPSCTGKNRNNPNDKSLASIMDWHYTASEFALQPTGTLTSKLWSDKCRSTQQWLTHGESDWETINEMYKNKDPQETQPWTFTLPYGEPNPGPEFMPLDFPQIKVSSTITVTSPEVVVLDVKGSKNELLNSQQVQIYLLKRENGEVVQIIDQGSPDSFGRIDLLGLSDDDFLTAVTWDGTGFYSEVYSPTITTQIKLTQTNKPLRIDAIPVAVDDSTGLTITVELTDPTTAPVQAQVFGVGGSISRTITLTQVISNEGQYSGFVEFGVDSNAFREGHIWVRTSEATTESGETLETITTYAIGGAPGSHGRAYPPIDPASSDGLLRLSIPDDNIPDDTFVIVLPTRGIPVSEIVESETSTRTLGSTPFAIRASGSITSMIPLTETQLTTPTLTMFFNQSVVSNAKSDQLHIYLWNESIEDWDCVGGKQDEAGNFITAQVQYFGIYAIISDKEEGCGK